MIDLTQLIHPIAILDIAIVTILIYKIISMVRGTRAEQLLKGIALLLVLNVLCRFLRLTTVTWILDQVQTLLLIAIPVVFQPELRKFLEQLGNSTLIPGNRKNREDEAVEQIVGQLVPFLMNAGRTHTGVLIALQQEVGLNEYVDTGIRVDGVLSQQLLGNIFIVNTPLHDGAVIIKDNTILAASCYLPLSEKKSISKALGTRHRAGIGLSEVSDAIVCIVSEETGAVSVAEHGELYYNLTENQLRHILMTRLKLEAADPFSTIFQKWRGTNDNKNKQSEA
ncbi:MAG: diadenylate cyclase CdaA [Peptococcaceae bacterium]|nr:diadenylate cyclase CdaA [Peptococcaceae bacterium]MBR2008931.1 diadenylate cyclase CdaA [Peptococcaceae bacterium]